MQSNEAFWPSVSEDSHTLPLNLKVRQALTKIIDGLEDLAMREPFVTPEMKLLEGSPVEARLHLPRDHLAGPE